MNGTTKAKVGWLIISNQIQFMPFWIFRLSLSLAHKTAYCWSYCGFWCKNLSRYKYTMWITYKTDRISCNEYVSWLLQLHTNRFDLYSSHCTNPFVLKPWICLSFSLFKINAVVRYTKFKVFRLTSTIQCFVFAIPFEYTVYVYVCFWFLWLDEKPKLKMEIALQMSGNQKRQHERVGFFCVVRCN